MKSGMGIGLFFCKELTTQFEGSITCESEVGFGTVFTATMQIETVKQASTGETNLQSD